jgi:dTDP-4-amino-4,6-dideoxygalactose transaminase
MKIWLARPKFFGLETTYLQEAVESNWIGTVGGQKSIFRDELSSFLNFEGSINLLNSGTSALHIALKVAGVVEGDGVLCSTLTFVASANVIKYVGAEPIFVDSELETWNMCPDLLEKALVDLQSKNALPKAVILVHVCGIPAKVLEIKALCDRFGVILIEDAAGAFGSKVSGQYLGTFGDFGIFSLNGNKVITGGSGGILLSQNKSNEDTIEYLISQAKSKINPYEHTKIGYNYAMTNLSVAIARGQLKAINQILTQKEALFKVYQKALTNVSFVAVSTEDTYNHWLSCAQFSSEALKEKIFQVLEDNQIQSRYMWKPMHLQTLYSKNKSYLNGNAELIFKNSLCLPSDINMSFEEQEKIIDLILSYLVD